MANGRKLNVGLVFDDSLDSTDGVAQYVKALGPWLSTQGHHVSYLAGETELKGWHGGKVYSLATNLKVRFNGNRLSMPIFSKRSQLKNVLVHGKFDVLHVMVPYSPLMAQRLILMADTDTAVVGTFHIFPSGWLSRAGSRLLRIILLPSLRKFDGFVSVSGPAAEFARQAYNIRSKVSPNPVDIQRFAIAQKPVPKNRIVFLGRLVKRKGCRQLIEAFAKVVPDYPDLELVIAGDGPERPALTNLAKSLNVSGAVKFLGYIDEKDKPALLGSATIACFPSLYGEAFGIVLVEAMAAGAEVVLGGNNPGYSSVLADHPELLFDPGDTDELANKLRLFLADPRLRKKAADWQKKAIAQYDTDVVGHQVEALYSRAIAKKRAHRHN